MTNELTCRICKKDGFGSTIDHACEVCYANEHDVTEEIKCMKCGFIIAYFKFYDNFSQDTQYPDGNGYFCKDCVIK